MEPLIIGIIVCIIIVIILVVYFLTRPKTTDKTKEQTLLDNAPSALGLQLGETFSNETSDLDVVFDSLENIKKNFMLYLNYLFPKMNVNEINRILKDDYKITKTMQEIFDEKKDSSDFDFISSFNKIISLYGPLMFKDTDDKIIETNVKLFIIVLLHLSNLILKDFFQKNDTVQKDMTFILSSDFKTNDIISIYIRTNENKNIPLSNAVNIMDKLQNGTSSDCYTTALCKNTMNIKTDFIDTMKQLSIDNMADCETLFNLNIVKILLLSINENTDTIDSKIEAIKKKLKEAGFQY